MKKLVDQFGFEWDPDQQGPVGPDGTPGISEDRATLLYMIDVYNKHLFELESHPVRKIRETLDEFARELLNPEKKDFERTLFRFRQFFSAYRVDEYTFIHKTFDDFKGIIWDFVDQLSDELSFEKLQDQEVSTSLAHLKDAVESNSIEQLRTKSREFIDFYTEYQSRRDSRRTQRMSSIKRNLDVVKKRLVEANHSMRRDHLTSAYNRKSFDEQLVQYTKLVQHSNKPVSLIILDIDHFKKINDTYGHDTGDFIIKECVRLLQETFHRETDFVARIGGEEFAVILPDHTINDAELIANETLKRIRKEVFVMDKSEIRFTVSMGIAQMHEDEDVSNWIKRADMALYKSKNSGRNRLSLAGQLEETGKVA